MVHSGLTLFMAEGNGAGGPGGGGGGGGGVKLSKSGLGGHVFQIH